MTTELQKTDSLPDIRVIAPEIIASLVLNGDISKLNEIQKVDYYNGLCRSLGLNPMTQPFVIVKYKGKEILYAGKDCTEQLRRLYGIGVVESSAESSGGVYVVTVKVQDRTGRFDISKGAISIQNLQGEELANAIMKAETKAKRRATLSIAGLGMLDESEFETIPYKNVPLAQVAEIDTVELEAASNALMECNSLDALKACLKGLTKELQHNPIIQRIKDKMKIELTLKTETK